MAISVTPIGSGTSIAASTSLTGVTVPASSLIVVLTVEASGTVGGSLSDGVNTYTLLSTFQFNGSAPGNGFGKVWYAANASLSSGTIAYTHQNSGVTASIAALYATGVQLSSPSDASVTATANGSSTTPSVTSGTPAKAGELFIGALGIGINSAANPSTDTTHNWINAEAVNGLGGGSFAGLSLDYQINSGTGTIINAPSLSATTTWTVGVFGFTAAASSGFIFNLAFPH